MRSARISFAVLVLLALPASADSIRMLVQSSPLAGFQYYAGNARWEDMVVGDRLDLVREPDNVHDPWAVRVEWRGEKLGYLPRKENRAVAMELDQGHRVDARIARLRQHRNPWQRVLIEVFVAI